MRINVKQFVRIAGILVLAVFAVMGIMKVIDYDKDMKEAERPPARDWAAEQAAAEQKTAAEPPEPEVLVPVEEQVYLRVSSEMTSEWFSYVDSIGKKHAELLADFDKLPNTTVDTDLMATEVDDFQLALVAWQDRFPAPDKYKAYDSAATNVVMELMLYTKELYRALHVDAGYLFTAKEKLDDVGAAVEIMRHEEGKVRGDGQ